jgi:hypothetical protein
MGRCGKESAADVRVNPHSPVLDKQTGNSQARTMRGNPHVPLCAGTRSWVAGPEREKRHQPGKTQPGARDHDHESEEIKK